MPALCSYVTSLISVTLNIFILCYIGEHVATQVNFRILFLVAFDLHLSI